MDLERETPFLEHLLTLRQKGGVIIGNFRQKTNLTNCLKIARANGSRMKVLKALNLKVKLMGAASFCQQLVAYLLMRGWALEGLPLFGQEHLNV